LAADVAAGFVCVFVLPAAARGFPVPALRSGVAARFCTVAGFVEAEPAGAVPAVADGAPRLALRRTGRVRGRLVSTSRSESWRSVIRP
jgi:hypothetical protein